MFVEDDYHFEVPEIVGSDYLIGIVNATDRDIGDEIE